MIGVTVEVVFNDVLEGAQQYYLLVDEINADDWDYIVLEARDEASNDLHTEYMSFGEVAITFGNNSNTTAYYETGFEEDDEVGLAINAALDEAYYDLSVREISRD